MLTVKKFLCRETNVTPSSRNRFSQSVSPSKNASHIDPNRADAWLEHHIDTAAKHTPMA